MLIAAITATYMAAGHAEISAEEIRRSENCRLAADLAVTIAQQRDLMTQEQVVEYLATSPSVMMHDGGSGEARVVITKLVQAAYRYSQDGFFKGWIKDMTSFNCHKENWDLTPVFGPT